MALSCSQLKLMQVDMLSQHRMACFQHSVSVSSGNFYYTQYVAVVICCVAPAMQFQGQ